MFLSFCGLRNGKSLISYFFLPLIAVVVWKVLFLSSSFAGLYTYFLCRQKVPKTSAHRRFFNEKCSWYFVGVRNSLGSAKWLCHFSYLTLRQSSTIPKNTDARFPKSFNAHQWIRRAQFSQAGGNSKKETGTDKITANSRSSSGIGQMLFERCSSCCCYCVESEFFCPRWLNEKQFASNNSRTKDVACDSWAEGCCDWFLRVPGALVLSRDERTYKAGRKQRITDK